MDKDNQKDNQKDTEPEILTDEQLDKVAGGLEETRAANVIIPQHGEDLNASSGLDNITISLDNKTPSDLNNHENLGNNGARSFEEIMGGGAKRD